MRFEPNASTFQIGYNKMQLLESVLILSIPENDTTDLARAVNDRVIAYSCRCLDGIGFAGVTYMQSHQMDTQAA